eukprot:EG_transcript_7842
MSFSIRLCVFVSFVACALLAAVSYTLKGNTTVAFNGVTSSRLESSISVVRHGRPLHFHRNVLLKVEENFPTKNMLQVEVLPWVSVREQRAMPTVIICFILLILKALRFAKLLPSCGTEPWALFAISSEVPRTEGLEAIQDAISEVEEYQARQFFQKIVFVPVEVPSKFSNNPIMTSFLEVENPLKSSSESSLLVLLHGFDSNCLEWRHVLPLLDGQGIRAYAFDILGWGFAERSPAVLSYSPEAKRQHLYGFWKQHLKGKPMILAGASVGGAMAIDFAHHHPEAVEKLILVAPQCFIDGVPALPTFLAKLGVQLLKSKWLRGQVTKQAYNTTEYGDAMLIGRLHTLMDRYDESAISFIQSGGYKVSTLVSGITQPVLVIWGRQDRILDPAKYVGAMPYPHMNCVVFAKMCDVENLESLDSYT